MLMDEQVRTSFATADLLLIQFYGVLTVPTAPSSQPMNPGSDRIFVPGHRLLLDYWQKGRREPFILFAHYSKEQLEEDLEHTIGSLGFETAYTHWYSTLGRDPETTVTVGPISFPYLDLEKFLKQRKVQPKQVLMIGQDLAASTRDCLAAQYFGIPFLRYSPYGADGGLKLISDLLPEQELSRLCNS